MNTRTQNNTAGNNTSLLHDEVTTKDLRRAAWTCSLGSALEYYDFALYSLASAIIFGPLFFPHQGPGMALIASFGTYFLGFAIRPVGGILFGSLGDRLGRKFVLLATVLLMGTASTLIGFLPTYETVGIWAPIMLVALRLLQGLGAGAEQAGAAVLMTEYAPKGKRGFYASLPFLGIQIGTFIAAAVYFMLLNMETNVAEGWLWRVPFLASVFIIAIAVYIRLHLKESPSFAKLEAKKQVTDKPLRNLLKTSRRNVLIGIGLRLGENGGSSIYQALAVSYLVGVVGMEKVVGTLCLISAVVVGAIVVPIAGWLTDRFGRVIVYRSFAIFQLAIAFPVWWTFSHGNVTSSIVMLSVALGVGSWGMFGAQGAYMPELFGARHRYIGVALAREVSAVIAGGLAPLVGSALIAWAVTTADPTGRAAWVFIASYLCLLTLGTVIATFISPETRDRDLDDVNDAAKADKRLPAAAPHHSA
ncbi:MHS family metabolite:H+ symporter-like MFS transporter [Raoultella sp. BIGb0138]|uniref:MFS transporter n=1 Tax=Raoultella sp. BIGb0138 TaxID=2485115 RepID=UPI00104EDC5D|nr:MFS transporter [Raoultella sp. BIGb0138]TCW06492.1 MHS family metabolite:H+ symporter-like MFS transporter [Raoultella sp. BIGb0138]